MLPSLHLPFQTTGVVDTSLITYARNDTVATYVGPDRYIKTAAANIPRVHYDPVTGKRLGFFLEQGSTNLLLHSENFADATWVKPTALISNAPSIIAPDGSTNTRKLVVDTINPNTARYMYQLFSATKGFVYTYSIFAKKAEKSFLVLSASPMNSVFANEAAYFDLTTGVVSSSNSMVASIEEYRNGWYRCSFSVRAEATATGNVSVNIADANGDPTIAEADGTSGITYSHLQCILDTTEVATMSYMPTTTAAATKSAETHIISGANFSNNISATEGTLVVKFTTNYIHPTSNRAIFDINDGTSTDRITCYITTSGRVQINIINDNITVATFTSTNIISLTDTNTVVLSYKVGTCYFNLNTFTKSASAGSLPNMDRIYLGSALSSFIKLDGAIKSVTAYIVALDEDTIKTL